MNAIRTIVVPHDFSEHSEEALETAVGLIDPLGVCELHLVHVVHPPAYLYAGTLDTPAPNPLDGMRIRAQERLAAVAKRVARLPVRVETRVLDGISVPRTIDAYADEVDADLVVMGTHGRSGISHFLHGSVTELAQRHAPCPVLTVRLRAAIEGDPLPTVGARRSPQMAWQQRAWQQRAWWNEGGKPKGLRTVGIFAALGTDAQDVLIFEAEDHEDIETMVEYWRNEVDLEIHPALDLAQRWRAQGMKIE